MQHLNTLTQKYQVWERLRTPPNSCQPVFKLSAQCVSARASLTLAAAHIPPPALRNHLHMIKTCGQSVPHLEIGKI